MAKNSQINPGAEIPETQVNQKQMQSLAKAFWNLAHLYRLDRKEQAILLGLKEDSRNRLNDLEKRQEIPVDADKFLRIANLIGIHKNLRILYPKNREIVYQWMKIPRDWLNNQTPMEFIRENPIESLPRLFSLRRKLDQIRCGQ